MIHGYLIFSLNKLDGFWYCEAWTSFYGPAVAVFDNVSYTTGYCIVSYSYTDPNGVIVR